MHQNKFFAVAKKRKKELILLLCSNVRQHSRKIFKKSNYLVKIIMHEQVLQSRIFSHPALLSHQNEVLFSIKLIFKKKTDNHD